MNACYCILAGTAACNNCPNRPMNIGIEPIKSNYYTDNKTNADWANTGIIGTYTGIPVTEKDLQTIKRFNLEYEVANGSRLDLAVYSGGCKELMIFQLPSELKDFLNYLEDLSIKNATDVNVFKFGDKYYENCIQE